MNDDRSQSQPLIADKLYISDALRIWTLSAITVIDLRHHHVSTEQTIENYLMPSSMFLCSYGGAAEVQLNDNLYRADRFGIFHGGKGTQLTIRAADRETKCYALYYRAAVPAFYEKELKQLLKKRSPFQEIYGFSPRNPLYLIDQLRNMHERWEGAAPLHTFYAKAAFYQFVYEIYEELYQGGIQMLQPDIVSLTKKYMDSHFNKPLSLQAIASMVHVSAGHLSRLFKKQEQISPQEYLIRKRARAAKRNLLNTDATLREIAFNCGFSDEFSLIKTFKSIYKLTPGDYRKINAIDLPDQTIGNNGKLFYSNRGPAESDHYIDEGDFAMFAIHRNKKLLLSAVISLMLLLSACGGQAPVNVSSSPESAADSTPKQTAPAAQQEKLTREFKHDGGVDQVPVEPQRIVADWYYGELLALGVRPIGYPEYLLSEYPYVEAKGTIGTGDSMEQIIELEPDLIISTWNESYQQFSKIAPSVLINPSDELTQKMRTLGDLVNRQDEAEKWINEFEGKLEKARKQLKQQTTSDTTVTVINVFQKELKVNGYRNMGGNVIYNLLQMNPPQKVKEMFDDKDVWNQAVSFEALPDVAGTHIILTAYDPEGTGRELLEELEQSPIWKSLDAVKNNRVHKIAYYDLFFDDPIAIEHQIEMLTEILTQ